MPRRLDCCPRKPDEVKGNELMGKGGRSSVSAMQAWQLGRISNGMSTHPDLCARQFCVIIQVADCETCY